MKHKTFRPAITSRELPPKLHKSKEGVQLLCPFCMPPHPIMPGQESTCGTSVRVVAVQTIIPARTARDKGLKCIKCHETGRGAMVRYMNGFIHMEDCTPGTRLLAETPKFSKKAAWVFNMKDGRLRKWLEMRNGRAQQVQEIDQSGKETGKVLGYFFLKAKV